MADEEVPVEEVAEEVEEVAEMNVLDALKEVSDANIFSTRSYILFDCRNVRSQIQNTLSATNRFSKKHLYMMVSARAFTNAPRLSTAVPHVSAV